MRGIFPDGEAITSIRRLIGLTQEQLAAHADCDVKTVRRAEKGEPVDLRTLARIASGLGVECERVTQSMMSDQATGVQSESVDELVVEQWFSAWASADIKQMMQCFDPNRFSGCRV